MLLSLARLWTGRAGLQVVMRRAIRQLSKPCTVLRNFRRFHPSLRPTRVGSARVRDLGRSALAHSAPLLPPPRAVR
jgi:hypothetical protein